MARNKINLRSNKGFTMQDLIVAMSIFTIFAGIVGTMLVATFKIQSDSQVDEVATLYAIQITEYIDKTSYDEVDEELAGKVVKKFGIPDNFTVEISTEDYNPNNEDKTYVKKVKTNIIYTFASNTRNITIERLKVRELWEIIIWNQKKVLH